MRFRSRDDRFANDWRRLDYSVVSQAIIVECSAQQAIGTGAFGAVGVVRGARAGRAIEARPADFSSVRNELPRRAGEVRTANDHGDRRTRFDVDIEARCERQNAGATDGEVGGRCGSCGAVEADNSRRSRGLDRDATAKETDGNRVVQRDFVGGRATAGQHDAVVDLVAGIAAGALAERATGGEVRHVFHRRDCRLDDGDRRQCTRDAPAVRVRLPGRHARQRRGIARPLEPSAVVPRTPGLVVRSARCAIRVQHDGAIGDGDRFRHRVIGVAVRDVAETECDRAGTVRDGRICRVIAGIGGRRHADTGRGQHAEHVDEREAIVQRVDDRTRRREAFGNRQRERVRDVLADRRLIRQVVTRRGEFRRNQGLGHEWQSRRHRGLISRFGRARHHSRIGEIDSAFAVGVNRHDRRIRNRLVRRHGVQQRHIVKHDDRIRAIVDRADRTVATAQCTDATVFGRAADVPRRVIIDELNCDRTRHVVVSDRVIGRWRQHRAVTANHAEVVRRVERGSVVLRLDRIGEVHIEGIALAAVLHHHRVTHRVARIDGEVRWRDVLRADAVRLRRIEDRIRARKYGARAVDDRAGDVRADGGQCDVRAAEDDLVRTRADCEAGVAARCRAFLHRHEWPHEFESAQVFDRGRARVRRTFRDA